VHNILQPATRILFLFWLENDQTAPGKIIWLENGKKNGKTLDEVAKKYSN